VVTAPKPNVENVVPELLSKNWYTFSTVHTVEVGYVWTDRRLARSWLRKSHRSGDLSSSARDARFQCPAPIGPAL